MAELSTIARPYAEAAFAAARTDGQLGGWSAFLADAGTIIDRDDVRAVTGDPRVSPAAKAELIASIVGGDVGTAGARLLALLAENDRLAIVPEVARQFIALRDAHEGTARADIETALPLDDATCASLVTALGRHFGKRIEPHVTVNPALIGGVTVRVGDEVVDASVRGKLAQMDVALRH
jgi:F-type H+-transporting ATPase subunit delta